MSNSTSSTDIQNWPDFVRIALAEEPYSSQVIFSISLLLVFVASLIGNTLTCIVIYYDKTMHTATNFYLFNLAVSDLLVTLPILLIVYQLLTQDNELYQFRQGAMACKFFLCINFIFVSILWNNAVLVMTALSIERYIAICYPMMLKGVQTWRRVGKIIIGIWLIAIVLTLPELWILDVMDTPKGLICFTMMTPTIKVINGVLAVIDFIIPLSIMVFVHTMIAFAVNDSQNNNLKNVVYNIRSKRKKVNKLIGFGEMRSIILYLYRVLCLYSICGCLVALTVSFVICWLPYFLERIALVAAEVQQFAHLTKWWAVVHKIVMFHSWFTTVLNPLLFSVMSTKFRKALKMLWNKKFNKRHVMETKSSTLHTAAEKIPAYL